jgi:hypothetical protein
VVEDLIEEMFRSAETGRSDYKRAVVVDAEPTKATKTTPEVGRRSLLKKDLTGPTLLEMSGKSVNQELRNLKTAPATKHEWRSPC